MCDTICTEAKIMYQISGSVCSYHTHTNVKSDCTRRRMTRITAKPWTDDNKKCHWLKLEFSWAKRSFVISVKIIDETFMPPCSWHVKCKVKTQIQTCEQELKKQLFPKQAASENPWLQLSSPSVALWPTLVTAFVWTSSTRELWTPLSVTAFDLHK